MSTQDFTPYWLIHEPGKTHGFAVVRDSSILTPEEAIARWRIQDEHEIRVFGLGHIDVEATLVTEPFVG